MKEELQKRNTFFGYLDPKVIENEKVVAEIAYFAKDGKPHHHDQWEVCYVLEGAGNIQINYPKGRFIHQVKAGDIIEIPPFCPHWMEVNPNFGMLKILLVYTDKNSRPITISS